MILLQLKLFLFGSKNTNHLKKFNLTHRLPTGGNDVSMKHLATIFLSFIYCKTTSYHLISTFVKKLMINNYHPLCYFCKRVGHFGFSPALNHPKISWVNTFCAASRELIQDRGTEIFWWGICFSFFSKTVFNDGPTWHDHWISIVCLLGICTWRYVQDMYYICI